MTGSQRGSILGHMRSPSNGVLEEQGRPRVSFAALPSDILTSSHPYESWEEGVEERKASAVTGIGPEYLGSSSNGPTPSPSVAATSWMHALPAKPPPKLPGHSAREVDTGTPPHPPQLPGALSVGPSARPTLGASKVYSPLPASSHSPFESESSQAPSSEQSRVTATVGTSGSWSKIPPMAVVSSDSFSAGQGQQRTGIPASMGADDGRGGGGERDTEGGHQGDSGTNGRRSPPRRLAPSVSSTMLRSFEERIRVQEGLLSQSSRGRRPPPPLLGSNPARDALESGALHSPSGSPERTWGPDQEEDEDAWGGGVDRGPSPLQKMRWATDSRGRPLQTLPFQPPPWKDVKPEGMLPIPRFTNRNVG